MASLYSYAQLRRNVMHGSYREQQDCKANSAATHRRSKSMSLIAFGADFRSILLLLILLFQLLFCQFPLLLVAAEPEAAAADGSQGQEDMPASTMNLDPETVKEALASLLRSESGFAPGDGGAAEDGFSEAAQEYLLHVQSVLSEATSPSELYIREQLADLETLHSLLTGLQNLQLSAHAGDAKSSSPDGRLALKAVSRLTHRLVKGPARDLLLPLLLWQPKDDNNKASENPPDAEENQQAINYADSQLARQISEAAFQLRTFLAELKIDAKSSANQSEDADSDRDATAANVADRLRNFAADVAKKGEVSQAGQDYLTSVLDRMLELENRQVKFNVEYPDTVEDFDKTQPKVSQVADTDDQGGIHQTGSASSPATGSSSSSSSAADEGGRQLFDQVLCRRAAAAVAAALMQGSESKPAADQVEDAAAAAAMAVVRELRAKRYQPAGMEAMLEAIEECLATDKEP